MKAQSTAIRFILRPGSFDQSTGLWFVVPPVVAWCILVAAFALDERFYPGEMTATSMFAILLIASLGTASWGSLVVKTQTEDDTRNSEGKYEHQSRHRFWQARTAAWSLVGIGVVSSGLVLTIWSGLPVFVPSADVPFVELSVLVLTVALLAMFSRYTSMTSRADSDAMMEEQHSDTERMRESFQSETSRLLDRNSEHWREEIQSLASAVGALNSVVALQRDTLRVSDGLLALERQRDLLSQEQDRLHKQRIRPSVAILSVIDHPGPIQKRIGVRLFNQGEDGRRVVLSFRYGSGPGDVRTRVEPRIVAYSTKEFDFGNIDEWPDSFNVSITVQLSDVDGNRFECSSTFTYERNRGVLGSDPTFDPSSWQYPPLSPL